MLSEMPLRARLGTRSSWKKPYPAIGHHTIHIKEENLDAPRAILCRQTVLLGISHFPILISAYQRQ